MGLFESFKFGEKKDNPNRTDEAIKYLNPKNRLPDDVYALSPETQKQPDQESEKVDRFEQEPGWHESYTTCRTRMVEALRNLASVFPSKTEPGHDRPTLQELRHLGKYEADPATAMLGATMLTVLFSTVDIKTVDARDFQQLLREGKTPVEKLLLGSKKKQRKKEKEKKPFVDAFNKAWDKEKRKQGRKAGRTAAEAIYGAMNDVMEKTEDKFEEQDDLDEDLGELKIEYEIGLRDAKSTASDQLSKGELNPREIERQRRVAIRNVANKYINSYDDRVARCSEGVKPKKEDVNQREKAQRVYDEQLDALRNWNRRGVRHQNMGSADRTYVDKPSSSRSSSRMHNIGRGRQAKEMDLNQLNEYLSGKRSGR